MLGCKSCDAIDNCLTCSDEYYRDGVTCLACIYPCTNCISETLCHSCGFSPENRLRVP